MPLCMCGCVEGLSAMGHEALGGRNIQKPPNPQVAREEDEERQQSRVMVTFENDEKGEEAVGAYWWTSEPKKVEFKKFKWGQKGLRSPYACSDCSAVWQCTFDVRSTPASRASGGNVSSGSVGSMELINDLATATGEELSYAGSDVLQVWEVMPTVMLTLKSSTAAYECLSCRATWVRC